MSGTVSQNRGVSALRAGALALAAAIVVGPLTVTSGLVAAVIGAFLGALIADRLQRGGPETRLLGRGAVGVGLAIAVVGGLLAHFLAGRPGLTETLGVAGAFGSVEALRMGSVMFGACLILRTFAGRTQAGALSELAVVAGALGLSFAAHRGGQVHRPLVLSDWAWSHGIDPALLFLVLGAAATLVLAALLVSEGRVRRLPIHAGVLVLLGALALLWIPRIAMPRNAAGALGLTGEAGGQQREQKPEGQEQSARERQESFQLSELPFRDNYENDSDQAPVAVALFHDDYDPPTGVYYFRQTAFSQFNGSRLVEAASGIDTDVVRVFPSRSWEVPGAPPISAIRQPLSMSFGLLIDHVKPFALDAPARVDPLSVVEDFRFQRTYGVVSHVRALDYQEMLGGRAGSPEWDDETWDHYKRHPADPRYRELAVGLLETLEPEHREDPLARAVAVKAYLDAAGIYSLKSSHAGAEDPTASFLFGDLTGYCVHFAHAATYLFRALGLPARVAAGYAVDAADRAGGSAVLIRGGNAHAWPEVYLEDIGWVVVDPVPERAIDGGLARVDPELQRLLGEMLRDQLREVPFDDPADRIMPADVGRWARLAALAIFVGAFAMKIYRRLAPTFAPAPHRPRLAYRAALDRLAELGLRRRFGETREAFARRVAEAVPSFSPITRVHLRAALGPGPGASPAVLSRLSRELRRELGQWPTWRRWLAQVDPISWMRTR